MDHLALGALDALFSDSGSDYIQVRKRDGDVLYENAALRALSSVSDSSSSQRFDIYQCVHPDDSDEFLENFTALFNSGKAQSGDIRLLLPQQSVRWFEYKSTLITSGANEAPYALIQSREITARIVEADALSESLAQYSLLEENRADYIQLFARDGSVLYDSPSYKALFGNSYRNQRQLGDDKSIIHPSDRAWVRSTFKTLVERGETVSGELRYLLPSGEVRSVEARAIAIAGAGQRTEKILLTARDVTERKHVEKALARS